MNPRVYICINGINAWPGDADGWTDRAVTWLNLRTEGKAEKFEYAATALTRRLWQQQRAEAIARMIEFYHAAGYGITLIGHSNGCDLIRRVLELTPHDIESIHLFAPATDGEDFQFALGVQVERLRLYVSAHDRALQAARASRRWLGWLGLGYGSMGLEVPAWCAKNVRCTVTRRDDYGHSTWFERGAHFESTMQLLLKNDHLP